MNANTYVPSSDSARRVIRSPLPGYPQRGVGRGLVMRYDRTGKPLWAQPESVENWQFLESSRTNPFLLFGAITIEEGRNRSPNSPVIWGLNKKTGTLEFFEKFEFDRASRAPQQQYVKVFVDAANESLLFLSSEWVRRGQFKPAEAPEE